MNNYKIFKKELFLLFALCCLVTTSCKNSGKHIFIDPESKINNIYNSEIVSHNTNVDSIENSKIKISESLDLQEHRVYYIDYSYSMVSDARDGSYHNKNYKGTGKTLLELTKDSLKQSIRNIQGKDVLIEIIPFLDKQLWNKNGKPTNVFTIFKGTEFNDSDLKMMDEFIDNIKEVKKDDTTHYNTHHSIAINDFIENRTNNNNQYHTMILLTDGVDESHKDNLKTGVDILESKWSKTKDKFVFGIYVNLLDSTKIDGELPEYFDGAENNNDRRFYQPGLSFDFNVFLIQPSIDTVYHRDYNIAKIAIGGCAPKFDPTEQCDDYYKYTLSEQPNQHSKWIEIKVEPLAKELPDIHDASLTYKYTFHNSNEYLDYKFFPSSNTVNLKIIDKKTPNVEFYLPKNKKNTIPCIVDELKYCKKFLGINPEWSDTITICIPYEKSDDAKYKEECNTIKLSINGIPEYAELLTPREVYLDKPMDTLLITFALKPSHENLDKNNNFKGEFIVEDADDFKAVFVNGLPLERIYSSNIIGTYEIEVNKCWHPLIVSLFWLLILVLILYLLYLIIVSWLIHKKPKFTDKIPAIQFITDPATSYKNLSPDYFDFKNKGHLYEHIDYIRFDSSIRTSQHKTYNIFNPLGIDRTLKGNIYIYPLESNIFAKSIELRPEKGGDISVYVDKIKKIDIEKIELYYPISEIIENNTLYKLKIKGYKPTC